MALFTIEHCDYSMLTPDELRRIKMQWERMTLYTTAVNTAFLFPVGILASIGVGINVTNLIMLSSSPIDLLFLIPLLFFLVLVWSIARMKYDDKVGYIVSTVLFIACSIACLIISIISVKGFILLAIVFLIPIILDVRSIRNYPILQDLKKVPGYPYFTFTTSQKYSHYIPAPQINKEQIPDEEAADFKPWNPFDIYDYIEMGEKTDDNEDQNTDKGNDI